MSRSSGCPPPVPVLRADAAPTKAVPDAETAANITLAQGNEPGDSHQALSNGPETQPLPPTQAGEVQIQVDAPFVFNAKDRAAPPVDEAAALPVMESSTRAARFETQVQPPPVVQDETAREHHGVLRRIGRFFAAIFR